MSTLLARFLIKHYNSLDISLKSEDLAQINRNKDLVGLNSSMNSIPTQSHIFENESQQSGAHAPPLSPEVETMNKYLLKRKNGWKVQKFVHVFKEEHSMRLSNRMFDQSSVDRSQKVSNFAKAST